MNITEQDKVPQMPSEHKYIVTQFSNTRAALDKIDYLFNAIGTGEILYEDMLPQDKAIISNSMVYLGAMLKLDDEHWAECLRDALVVLCKTNGGV